MRTKTKGPRIISPKETPKDRLLTFIEFKNLNNHEFEKMCGLSNGYVNNIKYEPSRLKLEQIIRVFPELDPMWVKYGQGSMLVPSDYKDKTEELEQLRREVDQLKAELKLRDELLFSQREALSLYREKVSRMTKKESNHTDASFDAGQPKI